jgi:KDO2-lipid IV(A) lauroyltransferase
LLACGRALGWLTWACGHRLRRVARANLEHCTVLPPTPSRAALARQSFVRAGENLALCLLLRRPRFNPDQCVRVEQPARLALEAAHRRGAGVVFVSAHLGPFELVAATMAALGYQPAVVVRESYDPGLNRIVDCHRHARRVEVIHRGHSTATARMLRALRNGRPVGVLPDLGGRVRSVDAELLGGRVAFPLGPALIAGRTGASVVVGTLLRTSTPAVLPQFTLEVHDLGTTRDHGLLTQRITAALTHAIAASPGDWLWMGARIRTLQENSANG